MVGGPAKSSRQFFFQKILAATGPMTLYVGLYQETLVGKIDRRNHWWVNPGFRPGKPMTAEGFPYIYLGWGCPGQRGPKSFFPSNNGMEYSMKIGVKQIFSPKILGHNYSLAPKIFSTSLNALWTIRERFRLFSKYSRGLAIHSRLILQIFASARDRGSF
jgi:hypothetical protein